MANFETIYNLCERDLARLHVDKNGQLVLEMTSLGIEAAKDPAIFSFCDLLFLIGLKYDLR